MPGAVIAQLVGAVAELLAQGPVEVLAHRAGVPVQCLSLFLAPHYLDAGDWLGLGLLARGRRPF